MKYQLILQFKGDSIEDLDNVVALENYLIDVLGGDAEVDGHDIGSGQTNIFIHTSDPNATFQTSMPVLESMGILKNVVAAYREGTGNRYVVIWPKDYKTRFDIL